MTQKPDFRILDDPAAEATALLTQAGGHVVITGGSTRSHPSSRPDSQAAAAR